MLFSSRVRFSVWLVRGYAHEFVLVSVVIVTHSSSVGHIVN